MSSRTNPICIHGCNQNCKITKTWDCPYGYKPQNITFTWMKTFVERYSARDKNNKSGTNGSENNSDN